LVVSGSAEGDPVAVRPIRLFGDPILRTPAEVVRVFDERTAVLAADLMDTVLLPGRAGVAAQQIGAAVRAFAWSVDGDSGYVLNPVLSELTGTQDGEEGCLSLPGQWFPTRRAQTATVTGVDAAGAPMTVSGSGLLARCLQHEVDHLDGHLFLDRLDRDTRRAAMRGLRLAAVGSPGTPPGRARRQAIAPGAAPGLTAHPQVGRTAR